MSCLHGLQAHLIGSVRGALDLDELRAAIRPDFVHCPRTRLVCVEQTHMQSGGSVVPLEHLRAVHALAKEAGLDVHMDGARLGNAVVASGIPAREWAECTDSVSVCLSKGLGAPVGSIVAGDAAFLESARLVRKRLGGWMRQAGVIAAPGRIALEHGLERLAQDHALARELAAALDRFDGLHASPDEIDTNIVPVVVDHPHWNETTLSERLAAEGVLVYPLEPGSLRFVTHLDVGPADLERLVAALQRILG
jgi:threonine aldolase